MIKTVLITIFIIFLPNNVLAVGFKLNSGENFDLCMDMLSKVRSTLYEDFHYSRFSNINVVDWMIGYYKTRYLSQKSDSVIKVQYAHFDINNDGKNELLVRDITSLRGKYGDYLYVFKDKEYDFSLTPFITLEKLNSTSGIFPQTPWPYIEHHIYLATIYPFTYKNRNYVGMNDIFFPKNYSRSFIIAEYPKVEEFIVKENFYRKSVNLNVLCEIQSQNDE